MLAAFWYFADTVSEGGTDNSKVTEEEEVQAQENNAQLLITPSALTAVVPL